MSVAARGTWRIRDLARRSLGGLKTRGSSAFAKLPYCSCVKWRKGIIHPSHPRVFFRPHSSPYLCLLRSVCNLTGDLYYSENAESVGNILEVPDVLGNLRRWAGWVFTFALLPILIAYIVWIPATLMGKCKHPDDFYVSDPSDDPATEGDVVLVSRGGVCATANLYLAIHPVCGSVVKASLCFL